ncbi:hypothetical protein N8375_07360 [Burkholderiaceae bacterium]|nr:hypothetical protein [Burkholderiaceae bacterium]
MIPCAYDALTGFYRDSFFNTDEVLWRKLGAQIYALSKIEGDTRTYVTDKKGIAVFDSDNDRDEGEDYSDQRYEKFLQIWGNAKSHLGGDEERDSFHN